MIFMKITNRNQDEKSLNLNPCKTRAQHQLLGMEPEFKVLTARRPMAASSAPVVPASPDPAPVAPAAPAAPAPVSGKQVYCCN